MGTRWVAQKRAMEAFQPQTGSDQSLGGPCLPGLGAPPPRNPREVPQTAALSALQLSTSVLPSSGGKQPVTVGLLWLQQAAFVSPNSETLRKATEWAGDCFLGREPQVLSTTVGRGNCIYVPGPTPVCVSFERRTHSRTTNPHANTHGHTCQSIQWKCRVQYVHSPAHSIFKFLMKQGHRNY